MLSESEVCEDRYDNADPLVDSKPTVVGLLDRLLRALRDTLMGLLVVETFKNRVTLKDPSILPFLFLAMMVSPVTDYGQLR
jgi:branched-subunit amino acid transport protein AzlD